MAKLIIVLHFICYYLADETQGHIWHVDWPLITLKVAVLTAEHWAASHSWLVRYQPAPAPLSLSRTPIPKLLPCANGRIRYGLDSTNKQTPGVAAWLVQLKNICIWSWLEHKQLLAMLSLTSDRGPFWTLFVLCNVLMWKQSNKQENVAYEYDNNIF